MIHRRPPDAPRAAAQFTRSARIVVASLVLAALLAPGERADGAQGAGAAAADSLRRVRVADSLRRVRLQSAVQRPVQGTTRPPNDGRQQAPPDTAPPRAALRIASVFPQRARPGDTIAIQFSDTIAGAISRLSIGGLRPVIVDSTATELLVLVPEDLPRSDTTPAILFATESFSQPQEIFAGLTVTRPRVSRSTVTFIGLLVGWVVIVMAAARVAINRRALASPPVVDPTRPITTEEPLVLAPLTVPDGLVDAISQREAIVYVGAGLGAQAGLPTWVPFVRGLLEWALAQGYVPAEIAQSHRASLEVGASVTVADALVSAIPGDALLVYLRETFGGQRTLPANYRLLQRLGFVAALTTSFDDLLEATYKSEGPVFIPTDTEPLRESLTRRRFFILKLYGALARPESVLVSPAQFRDAVGRNRSFSTFMESLFLSRTLFFVGSSLDGIQAYLDGLGIGREAHRGSAGQRADGQDVQGRTRMHYAVVAVSSGAWRSQAEALRLRYNIQVLPYAESGGHEALGSFLQALQAAVTERQRMTSTGATAAAARTPPHLESVHLENIGTFDTLDLKLDAGWNVILGDNGVGKSTILKAIALGLCGKDGERFAGRLVKVGQSFGRIVLKVGPNEYQTTIHQRDSDAEVSATGRAFEAEGWLALGFSPIRTITWERPKGPGGEGKRRPTSEDIIPIIRGEVDPRMNNIKQWFINQDYYAKVEGGGNAAVPVLDEFRTVIGTLLSGMKLDIRVENARAGSVIADTDDGPVPLELVSQGTASLLGWIGVLLQRLHEVYGDDGNVRDRYALVLVDEIDAHMHPSWQRRLITRLKRLFPNVQFIASTHSPLIVGGMKAEHLIRFSRVNGKVERVVLDKDAAMGRSDQVLRSELFDLPVTLDSETEDLMAEYQVLLATRRPTADQAKRRVALEKELEQRIPPADTEPAERRALELVQSVLKKQLFPNADASKTVLEEAQRLIDAAARQSSTRAS